MLAGDRMPSGRIIGARDTKPAHLVLQRSSLKSEALCGSPFAGYSSGRAFQSIEDCLPLCLLEGGRCRDNGAASGSVQLCSWHIQFVPLRQYHAALNEVLQLADISWPIGIHQRFHRGPGDRPDALLHTAGEACHKKVDQELNVFAPLAAAGFRSETPSTCKKGPRETDCCGSCFPGPDAWPQSDEHQRGWFWYFRGVRTPAPAGHAEALAANP